MPDSENKLFGRNKSDIFDVYSTETALQSPEIEAGTLCVLHQHSNYQAKVITRVRGRVLRT